MLGFAPRGEREWLWVSDRADFAVGKPLRGGIPICFPWFGPHAGDRALPPHGFARTRLWRLAGVEALDAERLRAELELTSDPGDRAAVPAPVRRRAWR